MGIAQVAPDNHDDEKYYDEDDYDDENEKDQHLDKQLECVVKIYPF